jgi:hypothetical protein
MEVPMDVGSASGSPSVVESLTRLAVAAQTARQTQQASSSVAVQALQLRNVTSVATGTIDTYAQTRACCHAL